MPFFTEGKNQTTVQQYEDKIAQAEAQIESLPEGRQAAAREKVKRQRDLLDALKEFDTANEAQNEADMTAAADRIYTALAGISVSEYAMTNEGFDFAANGQREIERISRDKDFRAIMFAGGDKTVIRDTLDFVLAPERENHLYGWGREMVTGRADYEAAFNRLCHETNEDTRAALKETYDTLANFNENLKGYKYTMGKDPDQVYDYAIRAETHIDKDLTTRYFSDVAQRDELKTYWTGLDHHSNMPAYLERNFSFYLPLATPDMSPEDAERLRESNHETIRRLCSDKEEDKAFTLQFTVNAINKLLAVKDEDLNPKDRGAALADYAKNSGLHEAFVDADKMLDDLHAKSVFVPTTVVDILLHKRDLSQTNFSTLRDKILTDNDPTSHLVGFFDEHDATEALQATQRTRYAPIIEKVRTNVAQHIMSNIGKVENHAKPSENPDPRYDGFRLGEDELIELKEPKHPGFLAGIIHGIFKSYKKEEFEKYDRDLQTYNEYKAEMVQRIRPEFKGQRAANLNKVLDHESARLKNQNAFSESMDRAAASFESARETARAELREQMDAVFSAKEGLISKGIELSRADYIMINGQSLRARLQTEFYNMGDKSMDKINPGDFERFVNDSLSNGHAYDLMLSALLKGGRVESFDPDLRTGSVAGPTPVQLPVSIRSMSDPIRTKYETLLSEDVYKDDNVDLSAPDDTRERMTIAHQSREAVKLLASVQSSARLMSDSAEMTQSFLGAYLREHNMTSRSEIHSAYGFSTDRDSVISHAAAYLMATTDMTPEQVMDPDYQPEVKAEAGKHIAELMSGQHEGRTTEDVKKELMSYNYRGMKKIIEYVDNTVKDIDLLNNERLFAPENTHLFGLCKIAFDLDQERAYAKKEYADTVIENEKAPGMPSNGTYVKGLLDKNSDDMMRSIINLSKLNKAQIGCAAEAGLSAGICIGGRVNANLAIDNAINRRMFSEQLAAGKNWSEAFSAHSGFNMENMYKQPIEIDDEEEARAIGSSAISGKLGTLFRVSFNKEGIPSLSKAPSMKQMVSYHAEPVKVAEEERLVH